MLVMRISDRGSAKPPSRRSYLPGLLFGLVLAEGHRVLSFPERKQAQEQSGIDLAALHGGFEDTARHEQYDFQQSRYFQKIRANTSSYTLPERLATSPAACSPELLRKSLLSSVGDFYETPDGNYYFEPKACRLRRLTGDQARQCLAGRHLDFIGDSVTRQEPQSCPAALVRCILQMLGWNMPLEQS